jgi:DNA-binding transcriptional ArsR family regulator
MKDDGTDLVWKALADPTRRRILDLLRESPRTTGEVARVLEEERGLSRCAAMKHLGVLEEAGLLVTRREGRFRWNMVNAAPFVDLYRRWVSPFGALPAQAALGLKVHVEGSPPGGGREEA